MQSPSAGGCRVAAPYWCPDTKDNLEAKYTRMNDGGSIYVRTEQGSGVVAPQTLR